MGFFSYIFSCFAKDSSGSGDYICDGGVCVLRSSKTPKLQKENLFFNGHTLENQSNRFLNIMAMSHLFLSSPRPSMALRLHSIQVSISYSELEVSISHSTVLCVGLNKGHVVTRRELAPRPRSRKGVRVKSV